MVYLYGLIEKRPLPDRTGVGGRRLARIDGRVVAAVVSEIAERPVATEDALWEHESVLEALMVGGPVLPVRFGVVFADAEAVERELEARDDLFATALAAVRGKVEIGVRVLKTSGSRPAPVVRTGDDDAGAGTRYMHDQLARRREAAALVQPIQQALSPLVAAERARLLPQPDTLLSAAYLVSTSDLDTLRAQVAELQRANADLSLVCTGPWPPYNFVDGARPAG